MLGGVAGALLPELPEVHDLAGLVLLAEGHLDAVGAVGALGPRPVALLVHRDPELVRDLRVRARGAGEGQGCGVRGVRLGDAR